MSSTLDTLGLGNLRLKREYPMADLQQPAPAALEPALHPEAAAAARARIAAAPNHHHPLPHPERVPATPTADLILNRQILAERVKQQPLIARPNLHPVMSSFLTAAGIFLLVLLLFKSPVILSQLSYLLSAKKTPTPTATTLPAADSLIPAENTITIPKINVHAPVIYQSSNVEADIQHSLENGVVHYGGTALPGQIGNTAIFGHSSNDWWEPGNYKFVFVLLDKLSPGDRLTIDYQSKRYTYEVTGSKIVEPTDVGVLNATSTPTLSLITCTPPGTALRRLVVTAKQVDPDPANATDLAKTTVEVAGRLPNTTPSFFDQLGQAWKGITSGFGSLFGAHPKPTPSSSASPSVPNGQLPAIK